MIFLSPYFRLSREKESSQMVGGFPSNYAVSSHFIMGECSHREPSVSNKGLKREFCNIALLTWKLVGDPVHIQHKPAAGENLSSYNSRHEHKEHHETSKSVLSLYSHVQKKVPGNNDSECDIRCLRRDFSHAFFLACTLSLCLLWVYVWLSTRKWLAYHLCCFTWKGKIVWEVNYQIWG